MPECHVGTVMPVNGGFLAVPTYATPPLPHDPSSCNNEACEFLACKAKHFWHKKGEQVARSCASTVPGQDLQYVWAANNRSGIGCILCFNRAQALSKLDFKSPEAKRARLRSRTTQKWSTFTATPTQPHHYTAHANQECHMKAIMFHHLGELDVGIQTTREVGTSDSKLDVPVDAWKRLADAVAKRLSARSFIEAEKRERARSGRLGFTSVAGFFWGIWCLAEAQRMEWQADLEDCRSVYFCSDAAGEFDIMDFQAFTKRREVILGTFGLTKFSVRSELDEKHPGAFAKQQAEEPEAQVRLMNTCMNILNTFCYEGRNDSCGDPGTPLPLLLERLKDKMLGGSFDGMAYAQLSCRQFAETHFLNMLVADRDTFHDYLRICGESAKKTRATKPFGIICLTNLMLCARMFATALPHGNFL